MHGLYEKDGQIKKIKFERYHIPNKKENELRDLIAQNPEIIQSESDLQFYTLKIELILDKDRVDVFLIDAKGLPIIVETKLEENPESQGQIVEQILRYASKLSLMDYDLINKRTDGELEKVIRSISKNPQHYNEVKTYFESKIKTQTYRLIIAVDTAPNNLIRTWLFENAHHSCDIRLVSVRKFQLTNNERVIIPYHVIQSNSQKIREPKEPRQEFRDVINEFKKLGIPGIRIGKIMATNCAIYITDWPKMVHYEFTDWIDKDKIGIEIMAELKSHSKIMPFILSLENVIKRSFPKNTVEVLDKGDYQGWVRLQIAYNPNLHPKDLAMGMMEMINLTREKMTHELISIGYIK